MEEKQKQIFIPIYTQRIFRLTMGWTMGEPAPDDSEFSKRTESFFASLLGIIQRYYSTFILTLLYPKLLGYGTRKKLIKAIGPNTFLCISGFIIIKIARHATVCFLIGYSMFIRGCESENYQKINMPTLSELITPPSLDQIISIGTPLVLGVLLLSKTAAKVITKKHGAKFRKILHASVCYSIGVQFLLWIPFCTLIYLTSLSLTSKNELIDKLSEFIFSGDTYVIITGVYITVSLLWPACTMYKFIDLNEYKKHSRSTSPRLRIITLLSATCIISVLSCLFTIILIWPAAKDEFNHRYIEKRYFLAQFIKNNESFSAGKDTTILIKNNSDMDSAIAIDYAYIESSDSSNYTAKIASTGDEHLFLIAKNQTRSLTFTGVSESGTDDNIRLQNLVRLKIYDIENRDTKIVKVTIPKGD